MTQSEKESPAQVILLKQLETLEQQIMELEAERRALQRLLLRVRKDDLMIRDVTRKNSVERILIENRILDHLRLAKSQVSAKLLFNIAKHVKPGLKDSTFRSHLKRMSDKGMIIGGSERGAWKLNRPKPPAVHS